MQGWRVVITCGDTNTYKVSEVKLDRNLVLCQDAIYAVPWSYDNNVVLYFEENRFNVLCLVAFFMFDMADDGDKVIRQGGLDAIKSDVLRKSRKAIVAYTDQGKQAADDHANSTCAPASVVKEMASEI